MKIDSKARRIQQKYRKKIEQEKDKKKLTIEAIIVVFFIVLLFPVVIVEMIRLTQLRQVNLNGCSLHQKLIKS
jgi:competence protein ComGC